MYEMDLQLAAVWLTVLCESNNGDLASLRNFQHSNTATRLIHHLHHNIDFGKNKAVLMQTILFTEGTDSCDH